MVPGTFPGHVLSSRVCTSRLPVPGGSSCCREAAILELVVACTSHHHTPLFSGLLPGATVKGEGAGPVASGQEAGACRTRPGRSRSAAGGRAPLPEPLWSFVLGKPRAGRLCGADPLPAAGPLGGLTHAAGSESVSLSPERRGRKARRGLPSGVTRGRDPRDRPPRSLLASACRGLPCAMRQKWPARAAVAREVCVATEMTSDLEGPLGARELSRQRRCCYGDHGAGPGAGATLRADQPAPPSLRTCGDHEPHIHAGAHRWPPPRARPPVRSGAERRRAWAGLQEGSVLTALRAERVSRFAQFPHQPLEDPGWPLSSVGFRPVASITMTWGGPRRSCARLLYFPPSLGWKWTPRFAVSSLLDFVEYKEVAFQNQRLSEMEDCLPGHAWPAPCGGVWTHSFTVEWVTVPRADSEL